MSEPISSSGRAFHADNANRRLHTFLTNAFAGDDEANDVLVADLDPEPGSEPRHAPHIRPGRSD